MIGHPLGLHRVIDPKGSLPQGAWKLNNDMILYDNELLIDVHQLNIDSASFHQIKEEVGHHAEAICKYMFSLVAQRGKHHNPVTGSGGVLIGKVKEIGPHFPGKDLREGDMIATLVSLTLTPLRLSHIHRIDLDTGQVNVTGEAILFASGLYAKLPEDLPQPLSLAVLDVCGAPAQTAKLVSSGDTVVILGAGGKSGLLSLYSARQKVGNHGKIMALEKGEKGIERLKKLQLADQIIKVDATCPVDVLEAVEQATEGRLADVVLNCANVSHTEMSAILSAKQGGKVYFFNMATSFSAAALGAEGVGKDVDLIIGNGYTRGHTELVFQMMRESRALFQLFMEVYG
ncbi:L-erythro-3,5-diaminohexanoate dehydrogenase [Microaerobacter geothermalis]|uniref:L-erythro-3,5-diaminohexanoate dehydrogenase n=1 Tax=Microaerobacter geothermalis TaxID=674972 RepID=UPI001F4696B2|nr:L-erythro-3,5-diaminohexanoate dehydrogenase [Microaerobacter geothermalis]MCF6094094.1 L-erythro-3,5-diaminohexanoate dehydrogenase [Microaerobacter geothermalis]